MKRIRKNLGTIGGIPAWIIGALLLAPILLAAPSASAITVGPNNPGTCTNVTGIGTVAWSPSTLPAQATLKLPASGTSNFLQCTGYGFSIPAGSVINGITVTITRNASNAGCCKDAAVRIVKNGAIGATDNSSAAFWPTTAAPQAYGSSTYLWGNTWTVADINAGNFGAAVAAQSNSNGNRTVSVDNIAITVDYTAPPTVTKSFSPTTVAIGVSSTLTITLTNPNTTSITGAALTDSYPAGLVNASAPGASTTCTGGTATAAAGGNSVSMSGGTIPASGSCTVTVSVTSSTGGSYPNTVPVGAVTFPTGGYNGVASNTATLTVMSPPVVTKAFGPNPIVQNGTSLLAITLSNSNATAITGVAFTDTYPGGLVNFSGPGGTCGGTMSATPGLNWVSLSGGTIPAGGNCTVTVTVTSAIAGIYVNTVPVGGVTSTNAGANQSAGTDTLIVNTAVGAFNAFETSTPAGSTAGPIWTKVSGLAFSLDVVALDSSKTTLQSGFSGNIRIDLVGNVNTGVALDANGCPLTAGLNQTVSASLAMSGARQTVSFPAVADAWRDVRVKISYPAGSPTVISCSGDNFAIRPNALLVSVTDATRTTAGTARTLNAVNLTDTTVHNAGQPFTVTIIGQNALGATTLNYSANPPVDVLAVTLGTCGGTACPAVFGSFALGSATSSGGTVTANTATYTDVGSFTLTIQDQSFANVDAADSSTAQRYITSSAINVGRFVPDHYTLITAGVSAPSLTNRSDIATCYPNTTGSIASSSTTLTVAAASGFSIGDQVIVHGAGAGGSDLTATVNAIAGNTLTIAVAASTTVSNSPVRKQGFTYFNEPFAVAFRLEARNAGEGVTANYSGALAPMDPTSMASYGFAALNTSTDLSARLAGTPGGSWTAGVLMPAVSLSFSRLATEDGPYNALDIGIAPTDPDGTALTVFDLDVNGDGTSDHAKLAQTMVRFGRLHLQNAFGSELLDLPVPMAAEYFAGGAYVVNSDDSCTAIVTGNLLLSSGTATVGGAFQAGKGNLKLTAPGSPVSIDLCVDLDVSAGVQNDSTCIASSPANRTYLQWKWSGPTFDKDPRARAVFGVYKNPNEFIYLRENF